jgi:hypothetical protein
MSQRDRIDPASRKSLEQMLQALHALKTCRACRAPSLMSVNWTLSATRTSAERLLHAGVTTEFHLYPGAYHASEVIAPDAELSKQVWATRIAALNRALIDDAIIYGHSSEEMC